MTKKKSGPLVEEEIRFITENYEKMLVEDIANTLSRRPSTISDFIVNNFGESKLGQNTNMLKTSLKKKPFYEDLRRQFTGEELRVFEYHYTSLHNQFRDDVFHTEEGQIIDLAKIEILMNRCLVRQNQSRSEIEDVQAQLDHEKQAVPDNRDNERIAFLMQVLASLNAGIQNSLREYNDLMQRKQSLLKEIKGTRDQRIKNIEDGRDTFPNLIAKLATNGKFRKEVGLEMERFRMAFQRERKRLSEEIKYVDGTYDRPLLNSNSLGD